jgi:general secretion pathway protein H
MPISATGNSRDIRAGFTLIELLIVIALLGLASATVILTGFGGPPPARVAAETLGARMVMARDLAISGGEDVALVLDATGYRLEARGPAGWEVRGRATDWPAGLAIAMQTEAGMAETARLRFDATGLASPAMVQLGDARVTLGADGGVRIDGR